MISLFNVKTVARYEAKTLLRSWFFRIFSGLALIFLLAFNLFAVAAIGDGAWQGRLVPSAVPYFNMWVLNIVQSIIAVFLSADFLGRDKKLDTTESFYVRSMSNIDYVLGKTFGILMVFVVLNAIVLLFGITFTLIGNEVPVNWSSYILYPLLISLPTLVFILGLSFFVMTLIRNQAITFVLLLGLIALSLFYLQNKWFGLLDFLGFYMPFMRSDLTGFGNELDLAMVRPAFFLLGLFFIMATIWRLPRLEQQKFAKPFIAVVMLITLTGALGLMAVKGLKDHSNKKLRTEINKLNNALKVSSYQINSYQMVVEHLGESIKCAAIIDIEHVGEEVGDLVLALNPGLKVSELSSEGREIPFKRDAHLIKIAKSNIEKGKFTLKLEYIGSINDMAMFPEVEEESLLSLNRVDPVVANKQFSFIEKNYLLLTREANWYPVVASKLYWTSYPFTPMDLTVKTSPNLTAISQGQVLQNENGSWHFKPEQKLNAYSLVIGQFEKMSTVVDSVEMSFYYNRKHDYFKPYFSEIGDTVTSVIKNIKNDFERKLGVKYPFKRFSLVESPINMHSYLRNWSLATENVMPEMVFFPEGGGGNWQNDFSRQKRRMERDRERSNQEASEIEVQIGMLKTFIGDNFIEPRSFFFGRQRTGERSVDNWGRYQIFPDYFSYTNAIKEDGYPLMTIALENYLHERLSESRPGPGFGGLSTNDEVILKLRDNSIDDLIKEEDVNVLGNVFASKGNQLLSNLKVNADELSFDRRLNNYLQETLFQNITLKQYTPFMDELTQADFHSIYSHWKMNEFSPAYLFGSINVWEIQEDNRIRYFVKVPVANYGDADGIISFTIRAGDREGGRRGRFRPPFGGGEDAQQEKTYVIPKNECKDVGFLLDEVPRDITVNTYLAENIPSTQRLEIGDVIKDKRKVNFFEGLRTSKKSIKFTEPYETIVDNEDKGFSFVNSGESKTIKDWWLSRQNQEEDDETYGMIRFWNLPVKWKPIVGENYFGEYLKSAYYKRKGTGEGYVDWKTNIKEPGNYEVYAYVPDVRNEWRRRGRDGDGGYSRDFHYTVEHDDGQDEIEVKVTQDNNGWLYLGEYYFSEGQAKVKLSDLTTSDFVVADAIKWVKK